MCSTVGGASVSIEGMSSSHGALVGYGELDGDQTTQGDTSFTQVWPPCRVKTYVLLV
jgi:hypothetical protein